METDPGLLLSLLAVRLLGGHDVPAGSAALKELKASVKKATDQGLLRADKVKLPGSNAKGKTTMKATPVVGLTEEGNRFLQQASSPDALAATMAGQVAALRQGLDADRKSLRDEVMAAVVPKGKGKGDANPAKELAALSKTVTDLAARLQKLESTVQSGSEDMVLAKIDQGFAGLTARLDRALQMLPQPSVPTPPAVPPTATPATPAPPSPPLRAALRTAYETLCCFREFQNGLVELPRLYLETARANPGLSVEAFRRAIETLWDSRAVELHILNEVREATEPDKAIRRDNKLYYFLYWRAP